MTAAGRSRGRPRGTIEELPSGALRVSVYVGKYPISGRRHYLRETLPAGAGAKKEAEKVLRRLKHDVDEQRTPRTSATLDQLLDLDPRATRIVTGMKHPEWTGMVSVDDTALAVSDSGHTCSSEHSPRAICARNTASNGLLGSSSSESTNTTTIRPS